MPQVELLKIFMASPSDVVKERRYVIEVIDEINRTIAPNKGVMLQVVRSEENVFPGYNSEGGQAVLNAQIANMEEYALFVGIMWNRVGTPTPRAESGTVEEFERAISAFERKGQPLIWFYFREAPTQLNTEGELEQRRKVLSFKNRIQPRALIRDYKNSSNFRDEFRNHITLWLNKRQLPLTIDQLWQQLADKATCNDRIGLVLADVLDLGSEYQNCVRLGSNIRFEVNLENAGYLLLLDKGTSGKVYCLCPSGYAPEPQVPAGLTVLPQSCSSRKSIKVTGNLGLEQLVAVIAKNKPDINWLQEGSKAPLQLRENHLKVLLDYLKESSDCRVIYMEFTVTA
ncbi:DUF4384 domain-containing protein [Tychonema sp. LEGE 07203]|uniref:DUF4384 domain-containing protein n=1 Tax=Tychonema sp. LEGE 07203 TaxID=1828671 RepID=UPI00187E190D|nr:DUF4384 domain-containing protein [Tychonema sp. LEGE 07203]MBE9092406.1 DUF4384 domain-containing protein [Tychonema sp. LEGE 07203]